MDALKTGPTRRGKAARKKAHCNVFSSMKINVMETFMEHVTVFLSVTALRRSFKGY